MAVAGWRETERLKAQCRGEGERVNAGTNTASDDLLGS